MKAVNAANASGWTLELQKENAGTSLAEPLEPITLLLSPASARGRLVVTDGAGRVYVDRAPVSSGFGFRAAGALGTHKIEILRGRHVMARARLILDAATDVRTGSGRHDDEFRGWASQIAAAGQTLFVDGRAVRSHGNGLFENRYIAAAARYFDGDVRSHVDLLLSQQKPNGLLPDRFRRDDHFDPFSGTFPGVHLGRDAYGPAFTSRSRDQRWVFERRPVSATIEALAVGQVFEAWQATGDDSWMTRALPALAKGLQYLMTDPLRWSPDLALVKRGFTIDTFDYQHESLEKLHPHKGRTLAGWWDGRFVDERTPMGIAHGDNSALYEATTLLSRMYAHVGDAAAAATWIRAAESLRTNLRKVAWNGGFFTHFVRLHPVAEGIDLGPNPARQLSMSNALAPGRGVVTHREAVDILAEYRNRRDSTRITALAECFTIDPPFRDGFAWTSSGKGENGGVTPVVAGALARAAFRHGMEDYGADVLARVVELSRKHGRLFGVYHPRARQDDWVEERFETVDLRPIANRNLRGDTEPFFIGHPDNDLRELPVGRRAFLGKPFDVIDPSQNGGRAAVVLWGGGGEGPRETTVQGIGRKARSLYFLHAAGNIDWGTRVGTYRVRYKDGTRADVQMVVGRNIGLWWSEADDGDWRIAWRGKNPHVSNVAVGVTGWNNVYPEKEIDALTVTAHGEGRVQLLGVTLSSAPVQFERGTRSEGIADAWAAAAVYGSVVEGLAGVTDLHRVFEHVELAPRWAAAGESTATVIVRYPAGAHYAAYRWQHDPAARTMTVAPTGSGRRFELAVWLPPGARARRVENSGRRLTFSARTIETSTYASFVVEGADGSDIVVHY
jgi:hypothetical protein